MPDTPSPTAQELVQAQIDKARARRMDLVREAQDFRIVDEAQRGAINEHISMLCDLLRALPESTPTE